MMKGSLIAASARARVLPRVTSSELADQIEKLRASGLDVVPLAGAPYWPPPEHVLRAAAEAASRNENAPSAGFPELRMAIARKLDAEGVTVRPESEILVTNGAMHALSLVFTTLLDPGDEVLLFKPAFFFFGGIRLAGGVPVYAETRQEQNWRWDAWALEAAITPRTKIIVLNSPTNPTGYVPTEEDLLAVARIAKRHDLIVVSDECYDNMVYDGARHIRVASIAELRDRTITICSFTKTLAMQPWRIGFIAGRSEFVDELQKTLEWTVLRCSHVAQRAAQAALEGPQDWVSETATRFQRGRDLMIDALKGASRLSFARPKAAPFLFLNVSQTGMSGDEFSQFLLRNYGVPTDGGAFFGSDSHVRLLFGAPDEVIRTAAKRIAAASDECSNR